MNPFIMDQERIIHFGFTRITTDEFAIGAEYNPSHDAMVNVNMAFAFNKPQQILSIQVKVTLLQQDKILAVLAVTCHFRILLEDWAVLYSEETNKLTIPKIPALHFASLTVSTTRGVLHAKTESLPIHALVIPAVNINDFIKSDLVLYGLEPAPSK